MKVVLKQGYDDVSIEVGNFKSAVALAEAILPFSSTSQLWIALQEDEPEEPEEKAPEIAEVVEETKSEAESDDTTDDTTDEPEPQEADPPKKKRVDVERIYSLQDAGWKVSEIADDLGCAENTVYYWLNRRK